MTTSRRLEALRRLRLHAMDQRRAELARAQEALSVSEHSVRAADARAARVEDRWRAGRTRLEALAGGEAARAFAGTSAWTVGLGRERACLEGLAGVLRRSAEGRARAVEAARARLVVAHRAAEAVDRLARRQQARLARERDRREEE